MKHLDKYFYKSQRDWILDDSPLKIALKSRQIGFSFANSFRLVSWSAPGRHAWTPTSLLATSSRPNSNSKTALAGPKSSTLAPPPWVRSSSTKTPTPPPTSSNSPMAAASIPSPPTPTPSPANAVMSPSMNSPSTPTSVSSIASPNPSPPGAASSSPTPTSRLSGSIAPSTPWPSKSPTSPSSSPPANVAAKTSSPPVPSWTSTTVLTQCH